MKNRNVQEVFAPQYLTKHRDILNLDLFNRIQSYMLIPPHPSLQDELSKCAETRDQVALSLNLDFYNSAIKADCDDDRMYALRNLLHIPDDEFLKQNYTGAYPTWLIQERLNQKEEKNHFKIVHRLVWMLLRLGITYDLTLNEPRASINEAVELILGDLPLKSVGNNEDYLGGEKAYGQQFKQYKYICHFIAAKQHMNLTNASSIQDVRVIEEFLRTAHWFRTRLLWLSRPNVKGNILFTEQTLMPLPDWISSEGFVIDIDPLEEKLQKLNEKVSGSKTVEN